jgi:regulatory protein
VKTTPDIRAIAMRLLAVREHSRAELRRKLGQKGFTATEIETVLDEFAARRLQSDARYVQSYIESRQRRGYGPVRIQAELREHGASEEDIACYLDFHATLWVERGRNVRRKKFGAELPVDYMDRLRQMRFLEYRGFTHEQLRRILETADDFA